MSAGYSGTPLARKLGIREGHRVAVLNAPPGFRGTLGALPDGLWISWPKGSSDLATDLGKFDVRDAGLEAGLVDNKVCAVDDDWSGLRFVYRTDDRP